MSVKDIKIPEARLTLEEQLELGKRMANGDKDAREKLVLSCVRLIKSFCRTPICQCFSTYDDVFQDGMLGALEAVDRYDYKRNASFITFSYMYIYKKMLKGIVSRAPLKISDKDFFNSILLRSTIDSFYSAHLVSPTPAQLSKLTDIPENTVNLLLKRDIMNSSSFEGDDFDEDMVVAKEDTSLTIEKTLFSSSRKAIVKEALETLSPNEKEIIEKRYLYEENKTSLKELAEIQKVSTVAVFKREKTAIKKLFAFFVSRNISFDDLI